MKRSEIDRRSGEDKRRDDGIFPARLFCRVFLLSRDHDRQVTMVQTATLSS